MSAASIYNYRHWRSGTLSAGQLLMTYNVNDTMNWAVFPWCYFLWNNTSVVFWHFLVFHTRLEGAEHSSQSLILPMKCFSAEFCELYLFLFFLFFSLILFHYSIYTSICWVFSTVWRKPPVSLPQRWEMMLTVEPEQSSSGAPHFTAWTHEPNWAHVWFSFDHHL